MSAPAAVGGQAVPNGVAMLVDDRMSVAVRAPDGGVATTIWQLPEPRWPALAQIPVLRGVLALGRALSLGVRAMRWAINATTPDRVTQSRHGMALITAISVLIATGLFVVGPGVGADLLVGGHGARHALAEGVLRLGAFVGYVAAIGRLPDVRELFAYHGAEHMAVAAHEQNLPLDVASMRHQSRLHLRCGTNFSLLVMAAASLLFPVITPAGLLAGAVARIAGLVLVVGVVYEVQKAAAANSDAPWARVVLAPGLGLQRLTTGRPRDDQLEVAAVALELALAPAPTVVATATADAEPAPVVAGAGSSGRQPRLSPRLEVS